MRAEVGHGGRAFDAGAHAVLLFSSTKRQGFKPVLAPESGQVGTLMERAVVDRAIAEIELDDAVGALVAQRVGHADAERDVPADDAVAAHESVLDVEQVHRAALALDQPGALAIELGHHLVRGGPEQQGMGMVAVGGDDLVARLLGVEETGGDRFLRRYRCGDSRRPCLAEPRWQASSKRRTCTILR